MALRGEMFNDREVALIGEHMQVAMEEAELSPEVPGQVRYVDFVSLTC